VLLSKGEADVLCQLSTFRHSPAEYADDFALILHDSHCVVREHLVAQSVRARIARGEALRRDTQLALSAHKRPSLTTMIASRRAAGTGARALPDSFEVCPVSQTHPIGAL